MNDKDISTFLAVVDSDCSYTKAEELIHLSQPAISKRIKSLEQRLRCKLFNKMGHKMVLTQQGQAFLDHARKIQFEWENASSAIERLNTTISGTLSLAVSNHMANHYLLHTLPLYKTQYPDVVFELDFFHSSGEIIPQVLANKAELGLMIRPQHVDDLLSVHIVGRESLNFVISAALYADRKKSMTIDDLKAHGLYQGANVKYARCDYR